MKRTIALVLAMILIVGLAACGESNTSDDKSKKPVVSVNGTSVASSDIQTSDNADSDINTEIDFGSGEIDFGSGSKIEFPDDDLDDDYETSSETPSNTTSDKVNSSNVTSVGTSSKDVSSKNNTASNNTSSKDTVSKNDTPSNNTQSNTATTVVTEFINTQNPNYTKGKLTIHPRHVYWKSGELVAQCFIVNGLGESLSKVVIKQLTFTNGNGQILATASFKNSPVDFISAIGRTLNHSENVVWEFTFGADTVKNYGADLSRIIISASTDNYK